MMYAIVDPSIFLSLNSIAILILALTIFSVILLFMRIRSWGVEFTPFSILTSTFTKDRFSKRVRILLNVSLRDIFFLRRAGAWCEENFHMYGRGVLMWGFTGLLIFSVIGYLFNTIFGHLSFFNPVNLLIALSQLLVFSGATMLLFRRLSRKNIRNSTDIHTWLLQLTFLLIGLSGFLSYILSLTGYMNFSYGFYIMYISSFVFFLVYYPFSELAFLVWKGSLLTTESLHEELAK
ncbi:MAG: hypothetical protein QXG05_05785 [Nitrososphaerota archaeon]